MNRRGFFKTLVGAAAATRLDVVDPGVAHPPFDFAELNRITLEVIYPSVIEDQFFKGPPMLQYFRDQKEFEFHG